MTHESHSSPPLKELIVTAGSLRLRITTIANIDARIDAITPEQFAVDERLPYWADVWHSAIALALFIDSHRDLFAGKRVLEVGCGLGVAGIAAVLAGAVVTFSDYDHEALSFAERNVNQNTEAEQRAHCSFLQLDWRDEPQSRYDLILAADVVYEKRFIEPLLRFLPKAVTPGGMILLAEPNRSVAAEFFERLHAEGFEHKATPIDAVLDGRAVAVDVHSFRVR